MMFFKLKPIVITFFLISYFFYSHSQERTLMTVHMKNGDVVSGYAGIITIPFATDYGNLAFPVQDVNLVILGVNSDGIDRDQLYGQLDLIRFGSLEESERAFDLLIQKDERILPLMRDYMQSPDYRPELYKPFTVELLYGIMLEKYNLPLDYSEEDVIVFDENYRIDGIYKFESIKLETEYGSFVFPRHSIKEIEVKLLEENLYTTKTFKLFADEHITANRNDGWLKTVILVKAGDILNVRSEGEIVLESLDGNTYTPDGGVNGSPPPQEKGPLFGSVVYKIGEKGATIVAGDHLKTKAETTGILYLSIYESVYNTGNKGYYETKVMVNQIE